MLRNVSRWILLLFTLDFNRIRLVEFKAVFGFFKVGDPIRGMTVSSSIWVSSVIFGFIFRFHLLIEVVKFSLEFNGLYIDSAGKSSGFTCRERLAHYYYIYNYAWSGLVSAAIYNDLLRLLFLFIFLSERTLTRYSGVGS